MDADKAIADAKAFRDKHFQHPTPEILDILAIALDCDDKEAQREKVREAIALARSRSNLQSSPQSLKALKG